MSLRLLVLGGGMLVTSLGTNLQADEKNTPSFRAILETAELGPEVLGQISGGPTYTDQDWAILLQVFNRLKQFNQLDFACPTRDSLPDQWLKEGSQSVGEMFELQGTVLAAEKLELSTMLSDLPKQQEIYRCVFRFGDKDTDRSVTILATQIPKGWKRLSMLQEPVRVRGVLVQLTEIDGSLNPLFLTDHIGWYPNANVPTGQLLLARQGMDVTLLDEVVHRQAFVKPGVTRESEAFYATLLALSNTSQQELRKLCKENVVRVAQHWKSREPELIQNHRDLETKLKLTTEKSTRQALADEVKLAKSMRGLATTVRLQAEAGQSSVAPMFLQPTREVGELYMFDGTARRAVRIAVEDHPDFDEYFELEVFPKESRLLNDQPVVCCVQSVPPGFPLGDQIREPVRITGIFFKSWRYRSRKLISQTGETSRQRQLYTPVLLGSTPTWLTVVSGTDSRWAFWGGIAFLGVLAAIWLSLAWLNSHDHRARSSLRRAETIDL